MFWDTYLGTELLGHMVTLQTPCAAVHGSCTTAFLPAVRAFQTPPHPPDTCFPVAVTTLTGVKGHLGVVLIRISLRSRDAEHLFTHSLAIRCLPGRNVRSSPLPILELGWLFL